jgi:hypothetical protein
LSGFSENIDNKHRKYKLHLTVEWGKGGTGPDDCIIAGTAVAKQKAKKQRRYAARF